MSTYEPVFENDEWPKESFTDATAIASGYAAGYVGVLPD
jgi:hypothetical protein